jgi:glutathione peroxidase
MRTCSLFLVLCALLSACSWGDVKVASPTTPGAPSTTGAEKVIDLTVKNIDGEDVSLSSYRGKTLLIVNTASQCGLTPQYEQLEALQEKYANRGFTVLGFPCNDFGSQEPGDATEIKTFCSSKYQVTFPLFAKVRALGDKSPLYKTLTEEIDPALRGEIKWNFTKFLVDPSGRVVARFEPLVKPLDPQVTTQIEKLLPQ